MTKGKIRHMFPGGNTPFGFYSYYGYIIDPEKANRIFILKGGPGTGKSTIMKKVGLKLAKLGYDIEFMHCSSDNNSLDGIVIPRLKIAVIDGTAPHVVDPLYPGAIDEIINLGVFLNDERIIEARDIIFETSKKKKDCFERAYRYLRAAYELKTDTEKILELALDRGKETIFIHDLNTKLFGTSPPYGIPGKQRFLFAGAITPNGLSNYLDSLCAEHQVIRLYAPTGYNTANVLKCIKDEAVKKGFFTEAYCCPMSPDRIEHIVLPELKISVVTANEYHDISEINSENVTTYYMDEFLSHDIITDFKPQLDFNKHFTDTLIQKAVESITMAKSYHDKLEKYYIKNIDFDQLTLARENLTDRILTYAKQ
ncbi:MAG: ATPase [Clostridiaceae bacterium]|nr:ATPase [Clostridiaceae bacterium]